MKNDLILTIGAEVLYQEQLHIIKAYLSLTSLLLINKITRAEVTAELTAISSVNNKSTNIPLIEAGTAHLPDKIWEEAERRTALIRPLATMTTVPATLANEVALKLAVSQRTVYTLIKRFRESGGLLTALAPSISSGGRGKSEETSDQLPHVCYFKLLTVHG